jgi:hypothetical protein
MHNFFLDFLDGAFYALVIMSTLRLVDCYFHAKNKIVFLAQQREALTPLNSIICGHKTAALQVRMYGIDAKSSMWQARHRSRALSLIPKLMRGSVYNACFLYVSLPASTHLIGRHSFFLISDLRRLPRVVLCRRMAAGF